MRSIYPAGGFLCKSCAILLFTILAGSDLFARQNLVDMKFTGTYRKTSKTSIVRMKNGTIARYHKYSKLTKLMAEFNKTNDDMMRQKYPHIQDVEPEMMRTPEELRNVEVVAYIYGAKLESDNDLHIVLSSSNTQGEGVFLNTEISGLPEEAGENLDTLKAVRQQFVDMFSDKHISKSEYTKLGFKKVRVRGSAIFDADHHPGCKSCPGPKEAKPQTVWEIHPITGIEFVPDVVASGSSTPNP